MVSVVFGEPHTTMLTFRGSLNDSRVLTCVVPRGGEGPSSVHCYSYPT